MKMSVGFKAGNIVIPGSKNPNHIKANFDLFDFALTGCATQSSVNSASETSDTETVSTENGQSQQIESTDMVNTENAESEITDGEIASENSVSTVSVSFENEDSGLNLAGILFLPDGFDETSQYVAVVVTGPMLSVKEQAQSSFMKTPRLKKNFM